MSLPLEDMAESRGRPTVRASQARAFAALAVPVLCYLIAAVIYHEKPITVVDELSYVRQAVCFAEGRTTRVVVDPVSRGTREERPSRYVPGTSALMAPFVRTLGWQGAYLAPILMLVAAVLAMATWLNQEGRSPLWALLMLANPSVLILSVHAMSDVPSMAAVTIVLLLFWRGAERHWGYWLAAGILASASCLIRETNAVLYLPFFLGALIRRNRGVWAVIVGGLLGGGIVTMVVLASGKLLPRAAELQDFGLENVLGNLPFYLVATMISVPAGLVVVCCYRGARALELQLTILVFLLFMLTWKSSVEGGLVNQMILHAPRFSMSLLPVFVWAWADVGPRWWSSIVTRRAPGERDRWATAGRRAVASAIAGIALAAIGMPIVFERWTQSRVEIVQTIYSLTPEKSVLVSNYRETQKVMNELYGQRLVVDLEKTDQSVLRSLFATGASEYVVLLLRTDGTYWQKRSADLQNRFETVAGAYDFGLILDRKATATDRLQIWKLKRRSNAKPTGL